METKNEVYLRPPRPGTQADRLLQYLKKHRRIRPLEAQEKLGIYRVADAAHKLRERNFDVRTVMVRGGNQFGEPVEFAEYWLGEPDAEEAAA